MLTMNLNPKITAERSSLKPILAEDQVIDTAGEVAGVFYTSGARRIAQYFDLLVALAAGVFLGTAWIMSLVGGPQPLIHLFTLLAFIIAGTPALSAVWAKISRFRIDIDVLMLLGACLAAVIGSPFEGALLLFLFALSGGLESYALRRTQSAITALRELTPQEASVISDGKVERMSLRGIPIGATILVRPGERIPLDGCVTAGQSSLDESAITGESMPRDVGVEDDVFAGTHNLNGRLEVRVTKLAADTTLAKIVALVTQARQNPAAAQRLVDRIGPIYAKVVIASAIAVGLFAALLAGIETTEAIRRSIAVLIVASPCALIIATPVAYLSAIAAAARNGVLIKGGAHLEIVASAKVFLFDKTGTLTTGKVRLTDVVPVNGTTRTTTLQVVGAIEATSNHPLADAVSQALAEGNITPSIPQEYSSTPGEGVSGVVDGHRVWIGRPELLDKHVLQADTTDSSQRIDQFRKEGKTVSVIVMDDAVGLLAFEDTIRDRAAQCIGQLRNQGVTHVQILTGDHEIVARKVAEDLKVDGYSAALVPEEKLTAMRDLRERYGKVVLTGDGINDAPALAHADVGIAMGSIGADVALEAADIVLMQDRIESVAWLHKHAQRTAAIVKQNLTLAISVIVVLSFLAAAGQVALPLAVIGHEGSTVLVALNALRLLRSPK